MNRLTSAEVTRLSPQERLALIEQLWDSLDDADVPVTAAQKAELDRRRGASAPGLRDAISGPRPRARFDEDRAQGVTWEQLKAELGQRRG